MILGRLKEETRALHDRIERNPRMCRLLEADLSKDEYRAVHARLYGFHAPVEARLGAFTAWEAFGFTTHRRVPLLRRDLSALGLADEAVAALPVCPDLPALEALPQALGCLYVLEGSTLGGRIIARHLRQSLGLDAATGAAFYHGYGDDTGARWKAFGRMLTAAAQPEDHDAVVASACATFETMDAWLSPQ